MQSIMVQRLVFTAGILGTTAAHAHPGHAGHGEPGLILGGLVLAAAAFWIRHHRRRRPLKGLAPSDPD